MKATEVGAIVGACLMFIGPFGQAAILHGGGGAVLVDRTWTYFEVSTPASLLIEAAAVVTILLVLTKQTQHALWCGIVGIWPLFMVKPSSVIEAFRAEIPPLGFSHSGVGWGIFVIGAGALITGTAGLFELRRWADERRAARSTSVR